MAQGFRFVCDKCDHIIVAWDDGNPYYIESVITKAGEVKQKKNTPPIRTPSYWNAASETMLNTSACPARRNSWSIQRPRSRRVRNASPVRSWTRWS